MRSTQRLRGTNVWVWLEGEVGKQFDADGFFEGTSCSKGMDRSKNNGRKMNSIDRCQE